MLWQNKDKTLHTCIYGNKTHEPDGKCVACKVMEAVELKCRGLEESHDKR